MGATRTIRRVARAAAYVALLSACHAERKQPARRPASKPLPASSGLASAASAEEAKPAPKPAPLSPVVVQTLSSLREQRLEITAPTVQSARLAFGRDRLLQASIDKVTLRDSKQGQVITEASIGAVRAVAHGPDGSLFAVGASGGALLEPRAKKAKSFPHVAFLPGSELLADLEGPSHFFVYYSENAQLYWYPFKSEAGSILPIEASFALEGCLPPLAQLRDGAIVCRTASGFLRQAPRGSRQEFNFPLGNDLPVRLLPGMRLDEFFALSRAGEVLHFRLADGLLLLARFQLPVPAYAAAANTEALAFVLVSKPKLGEARRWSLLVTNFEGKPRFESDLPAGPASAAEDWLAAAVEDKNLAISGFEPLVAVGGASRVSVWNYAQARALFTL